MEDYDHHVHTELAAREAWVRACAPAILGETCSQLVQLCPLQVVPKASPGIYLDRVAVIPSVVACKEPNGVRYVALTWPATTGQERVLRLYVDLPTGEAFLAERPFPMAGDILAIKPGLPFPIKRGIEDFIRQHTPRSTAA